VEFLGQVTGACQPEREIHVILDNLSAHKTSRNLERKPMRYIRARKKSSSEVPLRCCAPLPWPLNPHRPENVR
jgi:hypothetical protein